MGKLKINSLRSRTMRMQLKKMLGLILILSLVFSPLAVLAEAPVPPPETEETTLEAQLPELTAESASEFLEQFFSEPELSQYFHGAAVTIVKDGEVLAEEGFGLADVDNVETVDPENTVFRIASVSKVFTAVAIMQLVEEGKLELEEDIRTYLVDIDFENPYDAPVTIAHLLTHTTGFEIRDPNPGDIHANFEQFVEIEDYVRDNMPPVVRLPGTSYMYDNFASLLQGLIVEKVSGEPYQTYMEENIFQPLAMNDSGFLLEGDLKENLAIGYDPTGEPMELYTLTPTIMPHGGMLTTASDMSKFMQAFLNGGMGENGRILSEQSIQEMTKFRFYTHPLLPNTTYGFEAARQMIGAGSSDEVITKAGDLNGFSSYLWFIPEEKTGVFVTYNNNGILRDLLYTNFMYQFFPQFTSPAELKPFEPSSEQSLSKFEGLYSDLRVSGVVNNVRMGQEDQLTISNIYMGETPLTQVDELLFTDPDGFFVGFKQHEDGTIAYIDEPYLNPLGVARKVPPSAGFKDIDANHAFGEYILGLQALGLYPNDAEDSFHPEETVSRAEYIQNLMWISGIKEGSAEPSVFEDVYGHPAEGQIQLAFELGIISGNEQGEFEPDRAITREEAATVVYRSYVSLFPEDHFDDIQLAGETAPWAEAAVKMMVGLGYYGPEVEPAEDGSVDFLSKQPMTRQEEAAHHYLLLTKPIL